MCYKLNILRELYVPGDYERTANNLLERTQWKIIPVNIKAILSRLNIPYGSKDFAYSEDELQKNNINEGIQGMIHVEQDNIDIFYNSRFDVNEDANEKDIQSSIHKINFTLAHELAHSILHTEDIDKNRGFLDFYRLDNTSLVLDEKEIEANILAGEILMPKVIFSAAYQACIQDNKTFDETVNSLSILFNVSVNVIKARIDYLKLKDLSKNDLKTTY